MKIRFADVEAAHVFASMAEGMAQNAQDDHVSPAGEPCFEADQLNVLAQKVWDDLEQDNNAMSYYVAVDELAATFARTVKENCDDGNDETLIDRCVVAE